MLFSAHLTINSLDRCAECNAVTRLDVIYIYRPLHLYRPFIAPVHICLNTTLRYSCSYIPLHLYRTLHLYRPLHLYRHFIAPVHICLNITLSYTCSYIPLHLYICAFTPAYVTPVHIFLYTSIGLSLRRIHRPCLTCIYSNLKLFAAPSKAVTYTLTTLQQRPTDNDQCSASGTLAECIGVHWRVGRRLGSCRLISVQPLIGSTIWVFSTSSALWVLVVVLVNSLTLYKECHREVFWARYCSSCTLWSLFPFWKIS